MFTLQSYFSSLPLEDAIAQRAARLERVDVEQFCRNIAMGMIGTANAARMRPPGCPIESLDVRIFARGIVNGLVEKAMSMAKVPTTTWHAFFVLEKQTCHQGDHNNDHILEN